MKTFIEPEKEIAVHTEGDVVIIGGGPGGVSAALASAKNGAKTVLIERYGFLGGMQTQCFNPSFAFVDSAIQGGVIDDVLTRLRKGKAVLHDQTDEQSRKPNAWACVWFDIEYYKYLLETMMREAGVKLLYHSFGAAAIKEGNEIKGIIIESKEGRKIVLGKIFIDTTGTADIVWKSGAACTDEGIPDGPKKGRHEDFSYGFYIRDVNVEKWRKFRRENPDWVSKIGGEGRDLLKKAKEEGRFWGGRGALMLHHYTGSGKIWLLGPQYPILMGHHPWMIEDMTAAEIDMRKQAWAIYELLKETTPGFENSLLDQTPFHLQFRDTHRIIGDYVLKYEDILMGKTFDDSIAVMNMSPDYFQADGEHEHIQNAQLFDVPYRCLIPKDSNNLLAAGMIISTDLITQNAIRQITPSYCSGQAAGTAAALAVETNVLPEKLDVQLLQKRLRDKGARVTVKDVPQEVVERYRAKAKVAIRSTLGPQ
jgi:hypothetical protein